MTYGADVLSALNAVCRSSIVAAGPRYSPAIDPSAPNIEIATITAAIDALGQTDHYRASLAKLADAVAEAWTGRAKETPTPRKFTSEGLIAAIRQLRDSAPGQSQTAIRDISRIAKALDRSLSNQLQKLFGQTRDRNSKEGQAIDTQISYLRRLQRPVSAVISFTETAGFQLITRNRMFIRGEWGTGKTHLLCDLAKLRMERRLPTLLLLAHRMPSEKTPLVAICASFGKFRKARSLLRKLDQLGRKSGGRSLVIVDGINEGDRDGWRRGIFALAREVEKYEYVGLIISCRAPFDQQMLTRASKGQFVEVVHRGFEEVEFDAQREFFRFYDIPNPHVPLLAPEFSRPLFLKMLCKTFSGLTKTSKSHRIRSIASGQKGMTKLFEDFISDVGRGIEDDFGLPHKTCWRILKGQKIANSGVIVGIAATMAEQLRDHISHDECRNIVILVTGLSLATAERIVRRMITDGLLVENTIYDGGWVNILRLSYQRFSDHLICRHLLEGYLDYASEASIRRSFHRHRPLGKIFQLDGFSRTYRMPGLASAIMLEFPERVKRTVPADERELVFYLPKNVRWAAPFVDTFLEGLLWRDHDSFSGQTSHILSALLKEQSPSTLFKTFECLVCLASRPGHPYSADRLMRYLMKLSLIERDLSWSEFLRAAEGHSVVHRCLDWIEGEGRASLTGEASRVLIQLCAMFLTSTDRRLRDRATKALVLLGQVSPKDLFEITIASLPANDPYIPERLLAASYGVLLRCWSAEEADFVTASGEFARRVYDEMFALAAQHSTKHVLMRDYALNCIRVARKMDSRCLAARRPVKILRSPFAGTGPFPPASAIREEDCSAADSAIGMDFGNYTCGRLVRERGNYDFQNTEYVSVMKEIKWRILDLGYRPELFERADREISQMSSYLEQRDRAGRIDRYAKKYSWIAYFELYGARSDANQLLQRDPRPSDCDIDPSFPNPAKRWQPPLKPLFRTKFKSAKAWAQGASRPRYEHLLRVSTIQDVEGPWLLLDGYIEEAAPNDPRRAFTFLRGAFIAPAAVPGLKSRLMSTEYPGNRAIPETHSDYYTFAGEIPCSPYFAFSERRKDGSARRFISSAFEWYRNRKVKKRVERLSVAEQLEHVSHEKLLGMLKQLEDEPNGVDVEPQLSLGLPEYIETTVSKRMPGVKIELPAHGYAWESYHSVENQIGSIDFVAPAICEALDLRNRGSEVDLYDRSGRLASLYRESDANPNYHLLYLREDLLREYLSLTDQEMVWINWGERAFQYDYFERNRSDVQAAFDGHRHIHRTFVTGNLRPADGLKKGLDVIAEGLPSAA